MSLSLSGSTISQSNTDPDLSGLRSVSGVNWFSLPNGKTVYDLNSNNLQLVVNGDLTIDGDLEELHLNTTNAQSMRMNNGAVLRVGKRKDFGSQVRYSQGLAIVQGSNGGNGQFDPQGIVFYDGSRFEWNGGVIMSSDPMGCASAQTDVTGEVNAGTWLTTSPSKSGMWFRHDGPPNALIVNNVTLDSVRPDTSGAIIFARNGFTQLSFDMRCGFIQERFGPTTGPLLTTGAKFASNAFAFDYQFAGPSNLSQTQGSEHINLDVGTGLRLTAISNNSTGHVAIFHELNVFASDLAGSPVEGARIYIPTFNSGRRADLAAGSGRLQNGRTFGGGTLAYDSYTALSDVDGVFPTQSVLTGRYVKFANNAQPVEDLYSPSQTKGNEAFTVHLIRYGLAYASQDIVLRGSQPIELRQTLLPDISVTEPDAAVALAYGTQETSVRAYDHLTAIFARDGLTGADISVLRSGSELQALNGRDVIIDGAGSGEAIVTPTSITLTASSFSGDITTSGTVTEINGAVITGVVTDANGTRQPPSTLTITGLVPGNEVRIYEYPNANATAFGPELFGVEDVSGDTVVFSHTRAGQQVLIQIIGASEGFTESNITRVLSSTNESLVAPLQTEVNT